MSVQVHAASYVELYLHNFAITTATLTGNMDSGGTNQPTTASCSNDRSDLCTEEVEDSSLTYKTCMSGSADGTLS